MKKWYDGKANSQPWIKALADGTSTRLGITLGAARARRGPPADKNLSHSLDSLTGL